MENQTYYKVNPMPEASQMDTKEIPLKLKLIDQNLTNLEGLMEGLCQRTEEIRHGDTPPTPIDVMKANPALSHMGGTLDEFNSRILKLQSRLRNILEGLEI